MKYFDDNIRSVSVKTDDFACGLEIEFVCGRGFATKYNKLVHNEWNATLGFDGSGVGTKEFRSPVFISKDSTNSVNQMEAFCIEAQQYLLTDFKARFLPWDRGKPLGTHFSISSKFLEDFSEQIKRARIFRTKLFENLETTDLLLLNKRESIYPSSGLFYNDPENNCVRTCYFGNAVRVNTFCNNAHIRFGYPESEIRLEHRYSPSCDLETLFPWIKFILLNTSEPTIKVRFIK